MGESEQSTAFIAALDGGIRTGKSFVKRLAADDATRQKALDELPGELASLDQSRKPLFASVEEPIRPFVDAAGEMQIGFILIVAAQTSEVEGPVSKGGIARVNDAFRSLEVSKREITSGRSVPLNFLPELLNPINPAETPEEALEVFKGRAVLTLDNMVSEAYELLHEALKKFEGKFESFADSLGELAKSFTSGNNSGVIRTGLEKIISGLESLAATLKNASLGDALECVRHAIEHGLAAALAGAYSCDATKKIVVGLELTPSLTGDRLSTASNDMAALSTRYVALLKQARQILTAIGVAGGLLVLGGVSAHIAAVSVPVAYAIVFVATVLIGMEFAKTKMQRLISEL